MGFRGDRGVMEKTMETTSFFFPFGIEGLGLPRHHYG